MEVPVLIVGAGPVGLALANELGYRGVEYLLVDEGTGTVGFPAGEGIFSRTMEHIRRWGFADELRYNPAFPPDQKRIVIFATSFHGRMLVRFEGTSNAEEPTTNGYSPEGSLFCPKKAFDPGLREGARRFGVGKIAYQTRLVAFEQTKAEIRATIKDLRTGTLSLVTAQYLAGCDGARSIVRGQLDLSYVGSFAEGHNFAIYFRSPALADEIVRRFGTPVTQLQMVNVENRPYLVAVDGRELWRLSMYILPDEQPDPEACLQRVLGESIEAEVLQAQPWRGNRVVANRYGVGRAFLLGDAAHLRWPKGGFGANTGIGDAVDLGWKLAAVLSGWGGPRLLASYEKERRPIAVRNVNEASNNRQLDEMIRPSPLLDEESPEGAACRKHVTEQLLALRLREYRTAGIQLGYRYRNSPICVSDDSLEPPDDHWLYVPSTWPGSRAPHAWLAADRSTLDLFGKDFVLMRFKEGHDVEPLCQAAARRAVPFKVVDVRSPETRQLYERDLVLVRPDGHVAWRSDTPPAAPEAVVAAVSGW